MKTNNNGFIFVDIQYRLSVFGFLKVSYYHAHEDAVTNVGLFDQRMALEWVQKHIHKFGGDKNRVTLGGHQAGATSAIFQALANNGEDAGLFKNVRTALGLFTFFRKSRRLTCRDRSSQPPPSCRQSTPTTNEKTKP